MSEESWTIIVVGFLMTWVLHYRLERIEDRLRKLIEITHRIRINDRERDF